MNDLIRRKVATQKTETKFRNQPFDWKAGHHCLAMTAFHLRAMGHLFCGSASAGASARAGRIEKPPRVRGLLGARRMLDARGWPTVAEMIDAQGLKRIAPAAMLLGDLAFRASEDGLGGLLICVGPHKLMGWFPQNTRAELGADLMVVMDMSFDQVEASWRL